ncbi:MAG: ABC transporter ATP-binding protein [Clostridia bacterium]|nr:ABC transporter ATP-binding protein [Clostridia bacterium]
MKRWFNYARPYLPYFIIGPLCMIVEVIGEVLMPKFLSLILNRAQTGTLTIENSLGTAALMALTAVLMMAGGVGGAYFASKASVNYGADLRSDVYRRVQDFSFANIDKFHTGSLVTRLTNDVTQIQNFINMLLRMCLRSPGMLVGGIIMAVSMKPKLSLVLAVTVPLMIISVATIIRMGFPRFSHVQSKIDRLNATVQENITNVRVVKSFVREEHETEKFTHANAELKASGINAYKVMILMSPVMTLFMNITTCLVIWFGSKLVVGGDMLTGDLSAFINYVSQILMSLTMLSFIFVSSSRAMASGKRISEVLDEAIDLDDSQAKHKDMTVRRGEIEFDHVSFRYYKNNEQKVLDDVTLKIPEGKTVGIIGSTGCGKTTLVSLIARLYDVDEGSVKVDGVDVRDYDMTKLRDGVGMVLQKNVLFSGSVKDNLRWGDEDASDEELIRVSTASQAHGFISAMADGYDTKLDQGGANVSGGQKQRLCIARALLKRPKILILDDSTSAVDTATEAKIREEFKNTLSDSTKIIIAQRISSVIDADMIVVMNEGKITGVGTHSELLETNVEYQEIYNSQSEKKEA